MSRYIEVDAFKREMYHEAFETDTDMQRWDSGCWIRYKLFEEILKKQPTADVVEVVRCKDCRHGKMKSYAPPQAPWCCIISTQCHKGDFFCACGERRNNEQMCVLP